MNKGLFCIGMLLFCSVVSEAQLRINEICASNTNLILDEYGESSDWIELFNAGNEKLNLEGYYLSDDADNLQKWTFPSIELQSGQFLLIFASSNDNFQSHPHTNFKLSADGESLSLTAPSGALLDQVFFPALETDHSYGRLGDGGQSWEVFSGPSPAVSNENSEVLEFTQPPQWASDQQFYNSQAHITLNCTEPDCKIYFTRDGSVPTENNALYSSPIQLDSTQVIRAIALTPGKQPSATVTRTFFINTDHRLPIVALSTHPDLFWDWEEGILVDGPNADGEWPYHGANFWQDKEIPVFMEYFSKDQNLEVSYQIDVKIHGGRGARTKPMKPLRLMVKEKYGSNTIQYPFFEERERTHYKRLVLRNASGDFNHGHIRDPFLQRYFIRENLNVDALNAQPVVVYLNGKFYGLMYLREKIDEHYLKYNFGVDPEKVDILEEDSLVVAGNFEAFEAMEDFIFNHDLSLNSNYEQAAKLVDVNNLADVFIVMTALNNSDWIHNNLKYWREQKEDAKWRYFVFDLDAAMYRFPWTKWTYDTFGNKMVTYQDTNRHVNIFKAFLENENFRHFFINRYADLLNTTFLPEQFSLEVGRTVEEIDYDMQKHFEHWPWPGYGSWRNEKIPVVYEYLETRPSFARNYLREYFGLSNEVKLSLQTYPEGAGTIQVNSIHPDQLPWDGIYFNGVPVTLTIVPNPGFEFSHWQSEKTIKEPNTAAEIRYNFSEDDLITAFFKQEGPQLELQILGFPVGGELSLSLRLALPVKIKFSIFDMQGRLISRSLVSDYSAGQHKVQLPIPALPAGIYWLKAEGDLAVTGVKIIVP